MFRQRRRRLDDLVTREADHAFLGSLSNQSVNATSEVQKAAGRSARGPGFARFPRASPDIGSRLIAGSKTATQRLQLARIPRSRRILELAVVDAVEQIRRGEDRETRPSSWSTATKVPPLGRSAASGRRVFAAMRFKASRYCRFGTTPKRSASSCPSRSANRVVDLKRRSGWTAECS